MDNRHVEWDLLGIMDKMASNGISYGTSVPRCASVFFAAAIFALMARSSFKPDLRVLPVDAMDHLPKRHGGWRWRKSIENLWFVVAPHPAAAPPGYPPPSFPISSYRVRICCCRWLVDGLWCRIAPWWPVMLQEPFNGRPWATTAMGAMPVDAELVAEPGHGTIVNDDPAQDALAPELPTAASADW